MDIDVRPIGPDEAYEYSRVSAIAFTGSPPSEEDARSRHTMWEFDRTACAFDGARMVGVSQAITFDLAVPGGSVPAGGIANVGVLPTHRRRGLLTAMMQHLLDDVRQRGEPVALLTASEGGIYGRFGFGVAVRNAQLQVTTLRATGVPDDDGDVTLVVPADERETLVDLFDRAHRQANGDVSRKPAWWDWLVGKGAEASDGKTVLYTAIHRDASGAPDGYANYRMSQDGKDRVVNVGDFIALTPGATAGLWRYLIGIDLTTKVDCWNWPVDDALPWLLDDPRQAVTTRVGDFLWARLVDVPVALAARRYGAEGEVVLDVRDTLCPWNHGRFRLAVVAGEATCRPADDVATPDLALDVAALGSLWLGGLSWSSLVDAGRARELTDGAAGWADAMFATRRAPYCRTGF